MAIEVKKVDVWAGDIEDRPGGLAGVLELLAEAGASVECVIARRQPDRPGQGVVFVTPIAGRKQQDAARAAGLSKADDIATLRLEGADKAGLGGRITRAVAEAGVSMRGLSAMVMGRKFIAYIGFDTADDAGRASRAIKALDGAGGSQRAAGRR